MLFGDLPIDRFFKLTVTSKTICRKLDQTTYISYFKNVPTDALDFHGHIMIHTFIEDATIVPIRDADGRERLRQFQGP